MGSTLKVTGSRLPAMILMALSVLSRRYPPHITMFSSTPRVDARPKTLSIWQGQPIEGGHVKGLY
jgi:hypothetical protein